MSGHVVAKVGTELDFKAILGSFMDTVCKPCPGYGKDTSRLPGIFRKFLELDVQAMFGMRLVHDKDATWFLGSFRDTMCQIRDKSWPWKGRSLIFRHFSTVFGHHVQAMSGTHPGHDRDVTSFSGISRQFLAHGVQAMFKTHPSHDRDRA
ncbi:Hypothetical predicted protein [Olea europaea subsp. europaea]|uniref:Uncharacterized protein n=1 Tax=Olea europaea subsp. europaea TaxID=158383 RepID=A0A8S0S1U3_OLEEU|nr:Hypothetical predicted protein [Olea europaea subsp. europaea]